MTKILKFPYASWFQFPHGISKLVIIFLGIWGSLMCTLEVLEVKSSVLLPVAIKVLRRTRHKECEFEMGCP